MAAINAVKLISEIDEKTFITDGVQQVLSKQILAESRFGGTGVHIRRRDLPVVNGLNRYFLIVERLQEAYAVRYLTDAITADQLQAKRQKPLFLERSDLAYTPKLAPARVRSR